MQLGNKIREVRQKAKLTLNDLASKTGLTASYISQVERGLIDPSISSLRRISAALE
ncbi:helix-turn-helix domain-containing protein, partial [Acinetobacter baumannii]|uniref:helix-turn-helix domain-containing protein n=1 Tax=Acinetobacter baumannii TaxID=470 RepID=UPI00189B342F|nr:helix-turn-helix transcriptional regulator [Acinetobacter baumannii]